MESIAIDPNVLIFDDLDQIRLKRKIECINDLVHVFSQSEGVAYCLTEAMTRLCELGLWPNDRTAARTIERSGLEHYSANDVVKGISYVAQNMQSLEDAYIRALEIIRDPAISFSRSKEFLETDERIVDVWRSSLNHSAVIAIVDQSLLYFVGNTSSVGAIEYEFRCYAKESREEDQEVDVRRLWLSLDGFRDVSVPDGISLWKEAESAQDLKDAAVRGMEEAGRHVRYCFSFGPHFLRSMRENQACGDQQYTSCVFKAVLKVLTGIDYAGAKPFLSGDGKTQMEYGDFRAFRCHILKSHRALRLMFWMRGEEIIFANIGNKQELEISPLGD